MQIPSNGLSFEVDDYPAIVSGNAEDTTPILLIMGLGMPRTAWPLPLIQALNQGGRRVLRFDNRDAGLSSKLSAWGKPNVLVSSLKHMMGWPVSSAYQLDDMALDVIGLLDALALPRAHIVGVSMGGMIGQLLAADHTSRVASFTCIMSSSGARGLPQPTAATRMVLLSRPASKAPQAIVDHYVKVLKVIGSQKYAPSDDEMRTRIRDNLAPYYFPLGTARQLVAIVANGDRSSKLAHIKCPVQIIHGSADPLIPVQAAHDLHKKIPGSALEIIDAMAHDMPPALLGQLASLILRNADRAKQLRSVAD